MPSQIAPEGFIWVCLVCGRVSPDLYNAKYASDGWDEACIMNAKMCSINSLVFDENGRVTNVCWSDFDK